MSSTGKKFAEEFLQIGEVKLEDKVLVQDSEDGLVKYALVNQFNAAAHKEFEDFLKGEDADEIINKWSELEKFLAGLKETDDLATILSEKFNTKDFTKEKIKETLGIYDWALEETPPSGTGADFPLTYDAERDAWELKGNLVITKGLATYTKLVGFTNLDVMGGIKVDRNSIYINDNGELAVVGGAGGGLDESALADYLTTNKYATQTWVTNQKYFTQANFTKDKIKSTLGISDWALEALKPSYEWSEIGSKPTTIAGYRITDAYTKTEVQDNFLALTGGQLSGNLEVYKSTAYIWANNNGANSIGLRAGYDVGLRHRNSSNVEQWALAVANSGSGMWTRFPLAVNMSVDEPRSDYSLYVNGDSYTTGTFYLNGAPLTYNSSKNAWQLEGNLIVTGGLATYTRLSGFTDLDVMGGVVTDGTTIHINSAGQLEVIGGTGGGGSVSITGAASTIVSSNLTASRVLISNSSGKVAVSAVTSTELGYLDGVTSAIQTQLNNKQAKLVSGSNIKTINNQSILGSGNITISGGTSSGIDIDDVTSYLNSGVSGNILSDSSNSYDLGAVGNEWRTIYVRSIQAKAEWGIRFFTGKSGTTPAERMIIGNTGNVAIGTTSASERLHVAGNIYTTGTVTENSARKLKNVDYEGEGISLDVLKKVKVAKWHWKDKRDERQHIGAIADDLVNIIPEVVIESEDEFGVKNTGIAYGKAGFSIAASLIAPVVRHEDRIKELEKNIEKMQKELNQLRRTA